MKKIAALAVAVLVLAGCAASPVSGEVTDKQYYYEPGYWNYYTTTQCTYNTNGTIRSCLPVQRQQYIPPSECYGLFIEYEDRIIRRCVKSEEYAKYEIGDYATDVRGTP